VTSNVDKCQLSVSTGLQYTVYTGTAGANTSSTNRYWIHTAILRQCTVTPAKRPAVGGNITEICRAGYHQLRQLPSVVRSLSPYASKTLSRRANLLNRYSAAILMACDTCADMGQLQRTIPIRKTFLQAFISCRLDYCGSRTRLHLELLPHTLFSCHI